MGEQKGRSPPPPQTTAGQKIDAMPIKSRFYKCQNVQKLAFFNSKIEKFSGEGTALSSGGERDTPSQTVPPWCIRRLDPRTYGARLDS